MKYVMRLEDKKVDELNLPKIQGYKTLSRASRWKLFPPFSDIPLLPSPFLISHPDVVKNESVLPDYLEELKSSIHYLFQNQKGAIALRMATSPHMDHLPSSKLSIAESDFDSLVEQRIRQMIVGMNGRNFSEAVIYAHPWKEPEGFTGSADVYVSRYDFAPIKVISSYGSGVSLEWGGDKSIITPLDGKTKISKIGRKEVCFKNYDPNTDKVYERPMKVSVPESLRDKPVLSQEEVERIAMLYKVVGKMTASDVRLHWTRVNEKEEHTIDIQFLDQSLQAARMPSDGYSSSNSRVLKVIRIEGSQDLYKIVTQGSDYLYVIKPGEGTTSSEDLYSLILEIPSGSVIASTGGKLSHPAILARERNIGYILMDSLDLPKEATTVSVEERNGEYVVKDIQRNFTRMPTRDEDRIFPFDIMHYLDMRKKTAPEQVVGAEELSEMYGINEFYVAYYLDRLKSKSLIDSTPFAALEPWPIKSEIIRLTGKGKKALNLDFDAFDKMLSEPNEDYHDYTVFEKTKKEL